MKILVFDTGEMIRVLHETSRSMSSIKYILRTFSVPSAALRFEISAARPSALASTSLTQASCRVKKFLIARFCSSQLMIKVCEPHVVTLPNVFLTGHV
jgi:hypothetical protein